MSEVSLKNAYDELAGLGFAVHGVLPKDATRVSTHPFESGEGRRITRVWALTVVAEGKESMVASILDGEGVSQRVSQGKRVLEEVYSEGCVPA